jgi:DNA repair exonuclease SbcCD ATPase subunit
MSSGDKVYDAVAALLKVLGAEAAKGLVYWSVWSAMQNLLVPAVKKHLMGQSLSPTEIEVLRQQLLQQTQMAQQQATSTEQLARLVAERLKPMIQWDDFRRRELEKDLEHLKSLYRELERQYYMELDPQKRDVLAQRMQELRGRITEIEARLVAPW